jgi:hypothetical protein
VQGEWSVVARDSVHVVQSSCLLTVTVPKHYKKPRFLEPLKAVLTDEGAVNLECKVGGNLVFSFLYSFFNTADLDPDADKANSPPSPFF